MKNKNIIYKILASGLLLLGTGCTNLDENVYDKVIAEETVFKAEDLASLMAPAYTSFRDVYWGWDAAFCLYEESSDLIVTPLRKSIGWGDYYITMHQHTYEAPLPHAEGNWAYLFGGVNNVNKAIYQIEQIPNLENKEAIFQELRALRAIYYYLLLDNFRNVPIVTKYDLPKGFLPTQNTGKEVYDFVESELKEALPYLNDNNKRETKYYGKVTKWAAEMTLAKLYLNAEVYTGMPKWNEALAQVNDVINNGGFALTTNYLDNFIIENQSSSEQIFSIPFDQKKAGGSYWPFKTLAAPSQATYELAGGPWNGSSGIPQFIDTYDPDDQRLKDSWLGGKQFDSKGEPIMVDGKQFEYINYLTDVNGCEINEGYRMVKYEIGKGQIAQTSNDVPFYRLADAMMIKAECLLRTGQADEAAEIVTRVRERNFRKTNPAKATVTGAKLLGGSVYKYGTYEAGVITNYEGGADIKYGGFLDELAWEFVGEAHRKQDLIRFGIFSKKSWFSNKANPSGDFRAILPIPKVQLERNSNLKQNPGYIQ